jgi:hypothetical protein
MHLSGATVAAEFASVVEDFFVLILLSFVLARRQLLADPDVAAAFFVLDLLGMRALGRWSEVDERRTTADAVDLTVEGADATGIASFKECFPLRNGSSVVVAEVDLVATLPVMTALSILAKVLRLRARVLRRDEADDAFRAAANFARVTFAVPVTAVFEGLAVLVASSLVETGSVDQPEVALPSIAASSRRNDRSSISSANQLWI